MKDYFHRTFIFYQKTHTDKPFLSYGTTASKHYLMVMRHIMDNGGHEDVQLFGLQQAGNRRR
jgi:hypothetical protein